MSPWPPRFPTLRKAQSVEHPTELPPEALDDLCRYMGEYGWDAKLAVKLLRRRHGVIIRPLDAQYLFAVEMRRRAYS